MEISVKDRAQGLLDSISVEATVQDPLVWISAHRMTASADQQADQRISGSASGSASRSDDQRISQRISGSASGSADQRISGSASGSADQRIRQPDDHKSYLDEAAAQLLDDLFIDYVWYRRERLEAEDRPLRVPHSLVWLVLIFSDWTL